MPVRSLYLHFPLCLSLGERGILWPNGSWLATVRHLPLRRLRFPSSDAVAARASSVVWNSSSSLSLCAADSSIVSASSQIWLIRALISMGDDPLMIRAEDSRCDAKVASLLGIPFRMVRSDSFSVTWTLLQRLAPRACSTGWLGNLVHALLGASHFQECLVEVCLCVWCAWLGTLC